VKTLRLNREKSSTNISEKVYLMIAKKMKFACSSGMMKRGSYNAKALFKRTLKTRVSAMKIIRTRA